MEDDRGRLQVLKLITDVAGDAATLVQRLEDQRRATPLHPGLLPVTEIGLSDEGVYLASPVSSAQSVEGRLHGGRQTLDATLSWLRGVTAGLQAAHDVGVLHGAIHPRDVLVTDEGGMLTGVGVAPALEGLSLQAPVRVPYTAPERASGRNWDARADQYSLAMLALDALSGRRLIAGTIPAFDRWTLAETPTEDARLHEVFVRALHPDPAHRYVTVADWIAALAGPDRVDEAGALSRFAREGVIIAAPAAAAAAEGGRDIQLQPLEDPEGVALSLFPEEDATTEHATTATAAASVPSAALPVDDVDAEQEWLVADVPEEAAVAEPEPEPYVFHAAPAERPTIDVPTIAAAPESAEWQLDEAVAEPLPPPSRPVLSEPRRTWDPPAEETPSRAPWLVLVVALVLAALGYGTWRSLQGPAATRSGGDATAGVATPQRPSPSAPAAAPPHEAAGGTPVAEPSPPSRTQTERPRVVPQAPLPQPPRPSRAPSEATPAAAANRHGSQPAESHGVGRALIRSSPSGEVRINGQPRGETPVVLRDLPFGSYVVAISRPGFEPVERQVTLQPSQPVASLTVDLVRQGTASASSAGTSAVPEPPATPSRPVPAEPTESAAPRLPAPAPPPAPAQSSSPERSGGLIVVSTPAQSRIFVDGQFYGSTPASIPGLSPGAHTVRVEAPGYRPWEGRVMVVSGSRVRVQAALRQGQE